MTHICCFSSGLSSALATERVLQKYDNVEIVFMDTTIEDEDNYRFLHDCERRWNRKITIIREGRTPYEVAKDAQIIPNQKIAPCTFKLKIEPFVKYLQSKLVPITIYIGYDFAETHRCKATTEAYAKYGWHVDFPLLWKPLPSKRYEDIIKEDWGIQPPRMYRLAYTHANCGGCCVKQGRGDWLRTLINFPERYRQAEQWEQKMRNHHARKDYAILRDQSQKMVRPLTLKHLRENYENQEQLPLFDLDIEDGGCLRCSVGDLL